MPSPRDEAAKWSQAANVGADKYEETKTRLLDDAAARGFPAPTGDALSSLLLVGQDMKNKLTEANGKLYAEGREIIFQIDEFELKIAVEVAKLAMLRYKDELLNQVAIEQAQADAKAGRQRADIERINAEIESRQAAIIRTKAAIEHEINQARQQLIDAEYLTLGVEASLINAQIETARAKLRIIDSIYQVLAAEDLVLAAENRRAIALGQVIAAQQEIAAVKESMIPFYQEKASARLELAEAITNEAEIKKQIEELGYDRIEVKRQSEAADHQVRQAELNYEMAQESLARATKAVEKARIETRQQLQVYSNQTRSEILSIRRALEEEQIKFRYDNALEHRLIEVDSESELLRQELGLLKQDLLNQIASITVEAEDNATTVKAGAEQFYTTETTSLSTRRIRKGE